MLTDPASRRGRCLRSGLFSVLAAEVSVLGHVIGGGQSPDLALLVALSLLLWATVAGLARQRSSFRVLLATMGLTHVVFHLALTLDGHSHEQTQPLRMWAFHAMAAVCCAGLLAYGDRLLFRLASWAARWRPARWPGQPVRSTARVAPVDRVRPLSDRRWQAAPPGRSPPLLTGI